MSRAEAAGVPAHALPAWRALREACPPRTPCQGIHMERWHGNLREQRWAADQCLECPVMNLCDAYARTADERIGTWGGRTATERQQSPGTPRRTAPTQEETTP